MKTFHRCTNYTYDKTHRPVHLQHNLPTHVINNLFFHAQVLEKVHGVAHDKLPATQRETTQLFAQIEARNNLATANQRHILRDLGWPDDDCELTKQGADELINMLKDEHTRSAQVSTLSYYRCCITAVAAQQH